MILELSKFEYLLVAGFALIIIGFILITVGSLLPIAEIKTSGGIVIFIGPIPLIFGWGPYSWIIIIISILITITMILIAYLMVKRSYYGSRS